MTKKQNKTKKKKIHKWEIKEIKIKKKSIPIRESFLSRRKKFLILSILAAKNKTNYKNNHRLHYL